MIGTFGDTIHTFIERHAYNGVFCPQFQAMELSEATIGENPRLLRIDHLAICVDQIHDWKNYYEQVLDFGLLNVFKQEDISSTNSSLMTEVLQNKQGLVEFTLVEPANGKKKSQVQEFLEYNKGAGVQHIAFLTDDIIHTLRVLRANGLEFLPTPNTYYELLPERVGEIDESIQELQELAILVDRDEEGYLLQIFGHPIQDRPTLFIEIIQRKGSRQFGNGNIKALFEAVEREQDRRGNL